MTPVGVSRLAYRAVEAPPSRFDGTPAYAEWAARADAYQGPRAAKQTANDTRACQCGHRSISHGSTGYPGIGNGACGMCPCLELDAEHQHTEFVAGAE